MTTLNEKIRKFKEFAADNGGNADAQAIIKDILGDLGIEIIEQLEKQVENVKSNGCEPLPNSASDLVDRKQKEIDELKEKLEIAKDYFTEIYERCEDCEFDDINLRELDQLKLAVFFLTTCQLIKSLGERLGYVKGGDNE